MYSIIQHQDGLHPTYPLAMHYKWVVDFVTMPVGVWQMRYIVLAREDQTNQVEGQALWTKATSGVRKFLLENVICKNGCVDKITTNHGELNADEAHEFFSQIGVKLALRIAYNLKANGKSKRGHPPIIKALEKACRGKVGDWPKLVPYALWADCTTHSSVNRLHAFWVDVWSKDNNAYKGDNSFLE